MDGDPPSSVAAGGGEGDHAAPAADGGAGRAPQDPGQPSKRQSAAVSQDRDQRDQHPFWQGLSRFLRTWPEGSAAEPTGEEADNSAVIDSNGTAANGSAGGGTPVPPERVPGATVDPRTPEEMTTAAAPSPADEGAAMGGEGPGDPVVIVGGGFGGLYTALSLAEQPGHPPILLIEPQEQFLFLPLLYELLSGELRRWEIAPRYDTLLAGRGIARLQDRVERIEAEHHRLHTHGGLVIRYRRLVLASGGCTATFGVPGADRHCLGFRTLVDVERLRELVSELGRRRRPLQRLAVVGGGATGVELACKLADLCAGSAVVELIEQGPRLLPLGRAFNREQAELALRRRDVRVRTGTAVVAVEPDRLRLRRHTTAAAGGAPQEEEEVLTAQGVIWTAGLTFRPPALTPAPGRDASGRLLCDPSLQLQGQSDIFVAGDLARLDREDDPLPSSAQVAFQQAPLLAENLRRSLRGEPLQPFQWNDLGEMLSLGVQEASLCGVGLTLAGRPAFRLRQLAYLSRMPGLPHTLRVAAGWLADWRP